jgi:carbon monoxide dehydrogenase subunit G
MPGAKITERIDATHFKGAVSIKVGPASMSFKGDIEVRELDAGQRMLHLVGKGSDTTGSSGASMDLVARIEPNAADGLSQLVGRSEVTMSGKAAAFGGRMMGTVADQILKQFAGNFAAQVQAASAPGTTAASESQPQPPTLRPAAVPIAAPPEPTQQPRTLQTAASPAAPATELNALALLWAIIRNWFRGLFRRRPA